jgi:hypothetical protein
MTEEIFWLDKFEGEAHGGLFVRNPLFEFLERCEKQGIKVVGIKKPDDWNLELIFIKEKEIGGGEK